MNDPNLQKALKWGIENSTASSTADSPRTGLDQEALMALFGGKQKSDGDYMIENMHVILNKEHKIEDRLQAFDNFEQLVENLDNANNLQSLGLWTPLVETLADEDSRIRVFAAWCCGTAVQNNIRTQERLLIVGAIPTLVRLATKDTDQKVRKKAITALSSAVRNFQAGLDASLEHMPAEFKPEQTLDANDMDSVDILINKLRESA